MAGLDNEQAEARRLLDRHRYYGETLSEETVKTLEAVCEVDLERIEGEAFENGESEGYDRGEERKHDELERALLKRLTDQGYDEVNHGDSFETMLEAIPEKGGFDSSFYRMLMLDLVDLGIAESRDQDWSDVFENIRSLALKQRKRRAKDPFKGKTPAQMREALKVIYGALTEFER